MSIYKCRLNRQLAWQGDYDESIHDGCFWFFDVELIGHVHRAIGRTGAGRKVTIICLASVS